MPTPAPSSALLARFQQALQSLRGPQGPVVQSYALPAGSNTLPMVPRTVPGAPGSEWGYMNQMSPGNDARLAVRVTPESTTPIMRAALSRAYLNPANWSYVESPGGHVTQVPNEQAIRKEAATMAGQATASASGGPVAGSAGWAVGDTPGGAMGALNTVRARAASIEQANADRALRASALAAQLAESSQQNDAANRRADIALAMQLAQMPLNADLARGQFDLQKSQAEAENAYRKALGESAVEREKRLAEWDKFQKAQLQSDTGLQQSYADRLDQLLQIQGLSEDALMSSLPKVQAEARRVGSTYGVPVGYDDTGMPTFAVPKSVPDAKMTPAQAHERAASEFYVSPVLQELLRLQQGRQRLESDIARLTAGMKGKSKRVPEPTTWDTLN